jgi:hypothetical protein
MQCPRQKLVWTKCKRFKPSFEFFRRRVRRWNGAVTSLHRPTWRGSFVLGVSSVSAAQNLASAAAAYCWREGGACRDGICVLDGVSGRIGSGVLAGSGTRLKLMTHAERLALCRWSVARMDWLAVKMGCCCMVRSDTAAALTDGFIGNRKHA